MIKRRGYIFLVVLVCLFLTPFIQAQPPFETIDPPSGLAIEVVFFPYHKVNTSFEYHVHVYNASNGYPLGVNGLTCNIHLYSNQEGGDHIVEEEMTVNGNSIDFEFKVGKGNFSINGDYAGVLWCNNSFQGDFAKIGFTVNPLGRELESSESILYFLITLFAFGIFLGLLILNIKIPFSNPRSQEDNSFIGIEYKKYVKVALIPLTFVSFLWFFNFLVGLSTNYLTLNMYGNLMGSMFTLLTKLAFPLLVVVLLIELVLMVRDINIKREMSSLWAGR